MSPLCSLSDRELVTRLSDLVKNERHATVDVIEHLVEIERRKLYLRCSASSLHQYCMDRLGYDKYAAHKRHRVAKLALRLPQVLAELRAGTLHLTGLFLLEKHLTGDNADVLLGEARGKSRRELEQLIARWFPRPDVPARIEPQTSCSRATASEPESVGRLEPLSPTRVRVEFTARAELYDKLEKARALLSHALPSGDLAALFERALDALIEQESRRRFGAAQPRKARTAKPGSRHVPRRIQRAVWERDGSQCTFVDGEGRRCAERRFLTLEHRIPFALGGPSTLDNLCLLCRAHNLDSARQVFGESAIDEKIQLRKGQADEGGASVANDARVRERAASPPPSLEAAALTQAALCQLGFRRSEAAAVVGDLLGREPGLALEQLLRTCLHRLVPAAS